MTDLYTKLQSNISKDSRKKSGKLKCDGRTDRHTASKLIVPLASRYGTNNILYMIWNCVCIKQRGREVYERWCHAMKERKHAEGDENKEEEGEAEQSRNIWLF